MLRRRFAAQQARTVELAGAQSLVGLTCFHQLPKMPLVFVPVDSLFLVVVEDVFGRGELRVVDVVDLPDLAEEEFEIALFREAGELRHIVQPGVDQSPHAGAESFSKNSWADLPVKPIVNNVIGPIGLRLSLLPFARILAHEATPSPLAR